MRGGCKTAFFILLHLMTKTKGVLFDLFGTLVLPPSQEEVVKILIEYNVDYINQKTLYWLLNGLPIALCAGRQNWKVEQVRDFILVNHFNSDKAFRTALEEEFGGTILPKDWNTSLKLYQWFVANCKLAKGAKQLLKNLRLQGVKLGLISNLSQQWIDVIPLFSLDQYFDSISLSCQAGVKKPASDFFSKALETLGTSPKETILIGDSLKSDIQGAKDIGLKSLWIRHIEMNPIKKHFVHLAYRKKFYCDFQTITKKLNKII